MAGDMAKGRVPVVTVIGSGSWGTAVTGLVSPQAREIRVWSFEPEVAEGINERRHNPHQLTDYELAPNVRATTSMAEACAATDAVLVAVPSAFLRGTCAQLAPHVAADVPVLVLTKGVERGTGCLMADVVGQELGNPARVAVLSGPNHAEEISERKISAAVIAAIDPGVARFFQALLVCPEFRVYVSDDVVGVEACAAEKNVIAIACGIAAALGAGDNTLAALMTRGLAEVSRLVAGLGGDPLTCMGLAGMGDLVATCTSRHSRNRTFGEAFVRGESLEDYQRRTGMVVEGAEAAASVLPVAERLGIEVPITRVVEGLLFEQMPLAGAVDALLERVPRVEFYGLDADKPSSSTSALGLESGNVAGQSGVAPSFSANE